MLLKPKYFINLSCESFHKNATESQTKFLASKAEEERGILLETNMKEATYLKWQWQNDWKALLNNGGRATYLKVS